MLSLLVDNIKNEMINNNTDFSSEKIKKMISSYSFTDFEKYINNENKETRIKIYENELIDVYILIWNVNEKSKIHNHAKNGCWLKLLKGEIVENRYNTDLNLILTSLFKQNNISFMRDDIGYHNIENTGNEVVVSIHFYSPPNHKTIYYE